AAAALLGRRAELIGQFIRGLPELAIACASGCIGVMADALMPEVVRNLVKARVTGQFISARSPNHLRNMRIRMDSSQIILPCGQRVEKFLLAEPLRYLRILLLASQRIEIEQYFLHTSILDIQDALQVCVADGLQPVTRPSGHL